MCIACLTTIHASVASHQMSAAGGPHVNKFEQVSSLGHQMSPAGEAATLYKEGTRALYRGVASTVTSIASWVMVTWGPLVNRQT